MEMQRVRQAYTDELNKIMEEHEAETSANWWKVSVSVDVNFVISFVVRCTRQFTFKLFSTPRQFPRSSLRFLLKL
jgi:hypothetical protein